MPHELATFLRSRRERLQPSDVGFEAGTRRRTPGLRREEVARLVGMSVDYYARLEQGRGSTPSVQMLSALARALRMSDEERVHLFHLAGTTPTDAQLTRQVRPGVLHLLDRLDDTPAYVLDIRFDVLAWNALASALIADFSALPAERRNLLWLLFCDEATKARFAEEDWQRIARESVAALRSDVAQYAAERTVEQVVRMVGQRNAVFRRLWAAREVKTPRTGVKRIVHPQVGRLVLDYEVLALPERGQRLVIYTAQAGSESSEALRLLKVIGIQDIRASRGEVEPERPPRPHRR